jgi:hypothetical protein
MAEGHHGRLRIFMRSHGAENAKNRPGFYDKTACLASLVRAAEAVRPAPELVFVNDGPLPADRERLMAAVGEPLQLELGSNRASYRATVALAAGAAHDPDDLVWFAEDDYLYRPEAFVELVDAFRRHPEAGYLALYLGELDAREHADHPAPAGAGWAPVTSTTSSFGVRHRVLDEDAALLRLMPFTGGAFDHTTCLTLNGRYPFTARELRADLLPFSGQPAREWPRAVTRGLVRSALGARALRRPSRRRALFGPPRDLITHLELGAFDPTEDWEALARDSRDWIGERLTSTTASPPPP